MKTEARASRTFMSGLVRADRDEPWVPLRLCVLDLLTLALVGCGGASPNVSTEDQWFERPDSVPGLLVDAPSVCIGCIRLDEQVVLGDTTGEGILTVDVLYATRDSVGRYWLGQRSDAIKVFDATGTFLRTVGRSGQGPMEFLNPAPIHTDRRGNVHVFDNSNLRVTVVGPNYELVSEERMPGVVLGRAAAFSDDVRYAVNMSVPNAERLGHPVHVITAFELLSSFGMDRDPMMNPLDPIHGRREVSVDGAGHVYAVKRYHFQLDVWDAEGRQLRRWIGPELNDTQVLAGSWSKENPPPNRIFAVRPLGKKYAWVLSWRRRRDWIERSVEIVRPTGEVALIPADSDSHAFYTGVLEVVDLNHGQIVARREVDALPNAFIGDDLAIENITEGVGHPRIAVWNLEFVEPQVRR